MARMTDAAGVSSSVPLPPTRSRPMQKLTPALQRLILAFTTGLFLACAAQVSGQSAGMGAGF
jgi:hypothetical protein